MIIARTLTCGDPYRCNGFPNLLTESYNLHGCSHVIVSYNAELPPLSLVCVLGMPLLVAFPASEHAWLYHSGFERSSALLTP